MKIDLLKLPNNFSNKKHKDAIKIIIKKSHEVETYINTLSKKEQIIVSNQGLTTNSGGSANIYCDNNNIKKIIVSVNEDISIYCLSAIVNKNSLDGKHVEIENIDDLSIEELNNIYISWGLGSYAFDIYKKEKSDKNHPIIFIDKKADFDFVKATIESCCLIKNLVNAPANDFVPEDLANISQKIADKFKAEITITKGKELEKGFPLVHAVGKGSENKPRIIDFTWGKNKDPLVTIIGKGITFDTGGLNLKPPQFMLHMKKDMGGSAHALGLAWMIMSLKLSIRIRVIIPAAENSVSGNSFRPNDVIKSRKGITVEISDTDAEGRLVLADALTFATEQDKPEFLVDFATLTGAARVAVGYDIPALLANSIKLGDKIRDISIDVGDMTWPLPMWDGYRKEINGSVADLASLGSGRAGATHAGLFLREFICHDDIDWAHMDIYSWEQNGKAGRPKGGADTGMRAIFAYIKDRFS